ncbi:MAG: pseudouridine synthase [Pirellulales bacterium]
MSKKFKSNPPRPRGADPVEKPDLDAGNMIRLQKVLASAGHGSRRACEELISEGRVEVDGKTCTQLGTRVDPSAQEIRVDGEALAKPKLRYFVVNKPLGVLSTNSDPAGRERVIDLIRSDARLFPIGRLDKSSEGLIIVTNDGELANLLAHPRYGVEKTYLALVAGEPSPDVLKQLAEGVHLAEGWAKAKQVRIRAQATQHAVRNRLGRRS